MDDLRSFPFSKRSKDKNQASDQNAILTDILKNSEKKNDQAPGKTCPKQSLQSTTTKSLNFSWAERWKTKHISNIFKYILKRI